MARDLGKEIVFFLPVTPAPFLPNGGLPHLLSRTNSLDKNGLVYNILTPDGNINRLYTFFDPRVYQAFSRFIHALNNYFAEENIANDLWGIECGYMEDGNFLSFLEDRSKVYDQAFGRFIQAKGSGNDEFDHDSLVKNPDDEACLSEEFSETIKDLYSNTLSEGLSENFEGIQQICFLGSAPSDTFERIYDLENLKKYGREVFHNVTQKIIPSSSLIPFKYKTGVFGKEIEDMVTSGFLDMKLEPESMLDGSSITFTPLSFFELYQSRHVVRDKGFSWNELGLVNYLQNKYGFTYFLNNIDQFEWDEDLIGKSRIHIFHGRDMDKGLYNSMLKIFMSGGRVILDRSDMKDEFLKKMESFFLENSLKVEKINYLIHVHNILLGEGRLLVIDGKSLMEHDDKKKVDFWGVMISTFDITHLSFFLPEGIESVWKTRNSSTNELNFEEVRRVSFYNPTSYKKKVRLPIVRSFALLKVMDENNVKVKNWSQEVEIEMMPEGSISLDFGVYS
ncbi:MAG: hypothetical protein KC493_00455 [Bacteriovoracaceae bacterium]|nr:hypothetical protein [Bacteriovoracaceae bacterium]